MDESLKPSKSRSGRKPKPIVLDHDQERLLNEVIASGHWAEWQTRRAKAILGVAGGARICDLVKELSFSRTSIQRTCRQFEREGIASLLTQRPRTGRPPIKRWNRDELD
jgi:hypothetical protein